METKKQQIKVMMPNVRLNFSRVTEIGCHVTLGSWCENSIKKRHYNLQYANNHVIVFLMIGNMCCSSNPMFQPNVLMKRRDELY